MSTEGFPFLVGVNVRCFITSLVILERRERWSLNRVHNQFSIRRYEEVTVWGLVGSFPRVVRFSARVLFSRMVAVEAGWKMDRQVGAAATFSLRRA